MPLRYPDTAVNALSYFSSRAPVPSLRDTNAWSRVAPEIRAASFFSAKVEDARFLDRSKSLIENFLAGARNADGSVKTGSKSQFVDQMRAFMEQEGMATDQPYNSITNIYGGTRLGLIFDTNIRQAYGYAHYSQGMDPLILDTWPASRFIRMEDPVEPRPRHVAGEGDVRLKTDVAYWADWQNGYDIGGFGVPYAPFGFNSLMDVEDVSRAEAQRLGLIAPGEPAADAVSERIRKESPEVALQASTKTMDPSIKRELEKQLKQYDDRKIDEDRLVAEQADRDREEMLYRQMDAANAMPNADPSITAAMEDELRRIAQQRQARGTGAMFRVKRAAGGILKFLGDWLFKRSA